MNERRSEQLGSAIVLEDRSQSSPATHFLIADYGIQILGAVQTRSSYLRLSYGTLVLSPLLAPHENYFL